MNEIWFWSSICTDSKWVHCQQINSWKRIFTSHHSVKKPAVLALQNPLQTYHWPASITSGSTMHLSRNHCYAVCWKASVRQIFSIEKESSNRKRVSKAGQILTALWTFENLTLELQTKPETNTKITNAQISNSYTYVDICIYVHMCLCIHVFVYLVSIRLSPPFPSVKAASSVF